jgi:8-oxo-dGTP diphosphatase
MYKPIIGTLGFVLSLDRKKTLLVHRNARQDDAHFGKYNGLGGKMLANEDIVSCLKREIKEEAGIDCTEVVLRGTINWSGFGTAGEDWLGFIFIVTRFTGDPLPKNEEGTLAWHRIDQLQELPMWEGDRFFLPMVFDRDPGIFHGHLPYKKGKPLGWTFSRI